MEIDTDVDLMQTPKKKKQEYDVEIPSTPDTVASISSSLFHSPTVRIEHTVAQTSDSDKSDGSGFCYTLAKILMKKEGKMIAMLISYSILCTVGGSVVYSRYASLNSSLGLSPILDEFDSGKEDMKEENLQLKSKLNEMTEDILELTNEVSFLRQESDLYKNISLQLSTNLTNAIETNQNMTVQIEELGLEYSNLKDGYVNLENLADNITTQNDAIKDRNGKLEHLNSKLNEDVEVLQNKTANLTSSLSELVSINADFRDNVKLLEGQNSNLKKDLNTLQTNIQDLSHENSQFKTLNDDLLSLIGFLESIENKGEESITDIVIKLADLIDNYRVLAVADLEIQYKTIIEKLPCTLEGVFGNELFVIDRALSISDFYPAVMDLIDKSVLIEICVDLDDFEKYMLEKVGLQDEDKSSISLIKLLNSLETYTSLVNDYYFSSSPNLIQNSVSVLDWEVANFHCEELLPDSQYFFH